MKKIYFFLSIMFLSLEGNGQEFMQGLGGTLSIGRGNAKTTGGKIAIIFTGLTYTPRYNFIAKQNTSLSVGVPLTIGFGFTSNVIDLASGFKFGYDLPIVVDFNIGAKATSDNLNVWGGYLGTGFSFFYLNTHEAANSTFSGKSYGALVRTGLRINPRWHRGITSINLGFSWKYGFESDHLKTYNFSIIGDW